MAKKKTQEEFNARETIMRGMQIIDDRTGLDHKERAKWLNASEADTCVRKQWYRKHQPELADRDERGYARRGQWGEVYLVNALIAANAPLAFAGSEQVNLQDPKSRASGTPDGAFIWDDLFEPLDLKTKDPRFNMANLPKKHHVRQLQINMELFDLLMPDAIGDRQFSHGWLIYMDASNYDDIVQFKIERDRTVLKDYAPKRARKVLDTKSVDRLDREGKVAGGKECRNECDFRGACGVTDLEAAPRKRGNRGSKFDAAATRYADVQDQMKDLDKEKATLKEQLSGELAQRKTNKAVVGDIEVLLETVKGRTSLDKKAVAEAGIDLSPFEKTGASSTRLSVKRTK